MSKSNGALLTGINSICAKPVKVIAVTSGKGGVGKSSISVSLATALAQKNKNVLLLDADLALPNIDVMLGVHGKYNLSHVIQGSCHLSEILLQGPSGVSIIPGISGAENMHTLSSAQHAGIIDSFNELAGDWDYLIIDTAAGISDTVLSFTSSSQEIIMVVCDEPTSLIDTYALIKVLNKRYQCRDFHILANMVSNQLEGRQLFKKLTRVSDQYLDVTLSYLGAIPYDKQVRKAIKIQKSVVDGFPGSVAAQSLHQLAAAIDEWPIKFAMGGNTSFFLERLVIG